jgi:molybdopterin converting factor subunit 1
MKIEVIAFGIARDIIAGKTLQLEVEEQTTVGQLKARLFAAYPAFQQLRSLSIAVNEEYRPDDFEISAQDEVVIIPPVSGG